VAASILSSYKPYNNPRANHYINVIGQALAMASTKPETYGGYHFLIMDTNEINAFSAPGGFVMVSRGLLRCCQNETEVAAVLAHEIGHVENEHGLRAIKKSRWTSAFTILGTEAAKNLGTEELAELTKNFEGAINDVTATMVNSGYARKLEFEADASAVRIMEQIGYNPNGLRNMLREMAKRLGHDNRGFAKTHPSPADRISKIKAQLAVDKSLTPNATRAARFKKALRGI
jgi:predicted Zn-dependent protease